MPADTDGSSSPEPRRHFVFPKWSNLLLPFIVLNLAGAPLYFHLLGPLAFSPGTLVSNYRPPQPVPYSHEVHVGQLGMDCRYCHTSVENAGFAAIPPTSTCMNCHHAIKSKVPDATGTLVANPKLKPVYDSWETGKPIRWAKVHDLPDYAYFNHAVHVKAGVSCYECHGRVDKMDEDGVYTVSNLSMSWCIECHRAPEKRLRPREQVFNLSWGRNLTADQVAQLAALNLEGMKFEVGDNLSTAERKKIGAVLADLHSVKSSRHLTDCSTCHR